MTNIIMTDILTGLSVAFLDNFFISSSGIVYDRDLNLVSLEAASIARALLPDDYLDALAETTYFLDNAA
jgi:hypothetical protein